LIDELAANDWAALAADPEQLATLSCSRRICTQLGASATADALYERARDWPDRFVSNYAIACRGSMARYVALLARTAGRIEEAERAFERAVEANRAVGAQLYVAWSLWDWSELLRSRKGPGDVSRAAQLARQAVAMGRSLGLTRLLRATETTRASGPVPPHNPASAGAA
jgi:tetratricopeptide (TPR) repeat protein